MKAGGIIDRLPKETLQGLAKPLHALNEGCISERLDRFFVRWSRSYAFHHLATLKIKAHEEREAVIHYWRARCTLNLTHESEETFQVSSSFIGPADERGSFSVNRKAAFLSTALRHLNAGGGEECYVASSQPSSPLFLTGFPAHSRAIQFLSSASEHESFPFLEFRPLSNDFVRIYRMEPLILRHEGSEQRHFAYMLTADQRGFVLLSAKPFPDKFPFEMTLGTSPAMSFIVDSVQRRKIGITTEFCHVNFDRFLPSKTFLLLKERWGNERRENIRLERSLPMEIELSRHKRLYAITDNISVIGARIVHTHAIPPGVYFTCRVRLGDDLGDISFKGLLVWKKNLMTNLNMAGIKFFRIEENDRRRLIHYIQREIVGALHLASAD